jgi:hypothetical protein
MARRPGADEGDFVFEGWQDENAQDGREVVDLDDLLIASACDKAGIQGNNVESREIFLHAKDEDLDGLIRAHPKHPHLNLGPRELGAELDSSFLAFLD